MLSIPGTRRASAATLALASMLTMVPYAARGAQPVPTSSPSPAATEAPASTVNAKPASAPVPSAAPVEAPARNDTVLYISVGASLAATIIYALANSHPTKDAPAPATSPASPKTTVTTGLFRRPPAFSFHIDSSNEMVRGLFGNVVRMLVKRAAIHRPEARATSLNRP